MEVVLIWVLKSVLSNPPWNTHNKPLEFNWIQWESCSTKCSAWPHHKITSILPNITVNYYTKSRTLEIVCDILCAYVLLVVHSTTSSYGDLRSKCVLCVDFPYRVHKIPKEKRETIQNIKLISRKIPAAIVVVTNV